MSREPNLKSDQWFLKPRATDEMELTRESFKAFGRLFIWHVKWDADESGAEEDEEVKSTF